MYYNDQDDGIFIVTFVIGKSNHVSVEVLLRVPTYPEILTLRLDESPFGLLVSVPGLSDRSWLAWAAFRFSANSVKLTSLAVYRTISP